MRIGLFRRGEHVPACQTPARTGVAIRRIHALPTPPGVTWRIVGQNSQHGEAVRETAAVYGEGSGGVSTSHDHGGVRLRRTVGPVAVGDLYPRARHVVGALSKAASREAAALMWARCCLWLAVVAPFSYSTAKTAADIEQAGGPSALQAFRGGAPFVLWALSLAIAKPVRRGHGLPEMALGGFCGVAVASSTWAVSGHVQAFEKALMTVGAYLALARLVRLYPSPGEALRALAGAIHVALLAVLAQYVFIPNLAYAAGSDPGDSLPRLGSVVPQISANPLAYIAAGGLLSIVIRVGPRWVYRDVLIRTALLVGYTYVLILTRTRSGIAVGLAVLLLALAIRAWRSPSIPIFAGLIGAATTTWLWPRLGGHVMDYLTRGQSAHGLQTLTGRTVIWEEAARAWEQQRTLGLGYFTGHRLSIPGLSQIQSNIDNTWLETLVDVGLVGTVPLATFCLLGIWRLLRTSELPADVRLWAVSCALYGLGISFVNPTLQAPTAAELVLGFLLLSAFPPNSSTRRHSRRWRLRGTDGYNMSARPAAHLER